MENIEDKIKRLNNEIFNRLPKKVVDLFKSINLKFCKFYNEEWIFHHQYANVSKTNPYFINLNFFNISQLSDSAIKAVIVHELGHLYIIHKKDIYFNLLEKIIFLKNHKRILRKFEEKRADKFVEKWGFKKELDCFKKEGTFKKITRKNDGTIDILNENKLIKPDENRVDIFLKCDKCKSNYKIEYYYLNLNTKIFFLKDRHIVREINFEYPIHYKNVINQVLCIDCEKELTEIKVIKNPF